MEQQLILDTPQHPNNINELTKRDRAHTSVQITITTFLSEEDGERHAILVRRNQQPPVTHVMEPYTDSSQSDSPIIRDIK